MATRYLLWVFEFGYVITATFIVAIVRYSPELRSIEPFVWLVAGLVAIPSVVAWSLLARHYDVPNAFWLTCVVGTVGVISSIVWISIPGLFVAFVFLGGIWFRSDRKLFAAVIDGGSRSLP